MSLPSIISNFLQQHMRAGSNFYKNNFSCVDESISLTTITQQQWQLLASDLPYEIKTSHIKKQASFYYGRLCAEQALYRLNQNPNIKVGHLHQPIWPEGILGSITHTHKTALALAIKSQLLLGIGIDLERILDYSQTQAIMMSALNLSEREALKEWQLSTGYTQSELVSIGFSIKESFYKSIFYHVNTILEFSAIQITQIHQHHVLFEIQDEKIQAQLVEKTTHFIGYFQLLNIENIPHVITCVLLDKTRFQLETPASVTCDE